MMTATLEFEQPTPVIPTGRAVRTAIAAELTANPGRWILLGQWPNHGSARQMAYLLRIGGEGWQMFGPEFEAVSHTLGDEHRIYVRYAGSAA